MERLRIVVCGTVFGRYYLEGIKLLQDKYELVGIVAKGGERSQKAAERYGVPLITNPEKLTKEQVDVACVVIKSTIIGGDGTDLAKMFLKKGIHVIQEQPVHLKDYQECLMLSKNNNCKYSLNTFYPHLGNIRKMIEVAYVLKKHMPITFIRAECSVQLLFPMLDMIGRVVGGLSPNKFEKLNGEFKQRFAVLNGEIRDVPILLTVDNQMDLSAKESNLTMFHRMQIGTPKGTLMLTDTHSELLWFPVLHEDLKMLDPGKENEMSRIPICQNLTDGEDRTLGEIFNYQWPECMADSFLEFYEDVMAKRFIKAENQQMIYLCHLWNDVGNLLGPYEQVETFLEYPANIYELLRKDNDE